MLYGKSFTDYYGDAPKAPEWREDGRFEAKLQRTQFLLWDEALQLLSDWAKATHPEDAAISLSRESWGNVRSREMNDQPFSVWISAEARMVEAATLEQVVAKVTGRTH